MNKEFYAIKVDAIEEVIAQPKHITPIPLTSKEVKGIINLRGKIVKIITKKTENNSQSIIVMKKNNNLIGLEVDSVDAIVDLSNYKHDTQHKFELLSNDKEILVFIKDLKELFPNVSI